MPTANTLFGIGACAVLIGFPVMLFSGFYFIGAFTLAPIVGISFVGAALQDKSYRPFLIFGIPLLLCFATVILLTLAGVPYVPLF
jgi:hypothetical protein